MKYNFKISESDPRAERYLMQNEFIYKQFTLQNIILKIENKIKMKWKSFYLKECYKYENKMVLSVVIL